MIDDPVQYRHVTLWGRSPALEASLLVPRPAPRGPEFLAVAADRIGLRGFWSHPRRLRGEPDAHEFAGPDDLPVVVLVPLAEEAGGGVAAANAFRIDPVLDRPEAAELLLYLPYDIVEMAFDVAFLEERIDGHVRMTREVLRWIAALGLAFRATHASVHFEHFFPGWAAEDLPSDPGCWLRANLVDVMGLPAARRHGDRALVRWEDLHLDLGMAQHGNGDLA